MLEIRPCCEHCGKDLPNNSTEAMICSFECTYCEACAIEIFQNVCPSCGGNFEKRPIRPKNKILRYAASDRRVYLPKNLVEVATLLDEYKDVLPEKR